MSNIFLKIPKANPFKFLPVDSKNINMDEVYVSEQVLPYMTRPNPYYFQKWQRSDRTNLQIECSIVPDDLKFYDYTGTVYQSYSWTLAYDATTYKVFETEVLFSHFDPGYFFAYISATDMSTGIVNDALTECFEVRQNQPGTTLINYKNLFNDFDVAFSTGIDFNFRCECAIDDFNPELDSVDYQGQFTAALLASYPKRSFNLIVGGTPGVPWWVVDLLNLIFALTNVKIQGKYYKFFTGTKWQVNRVRGQLMIGALLQIEETTTPYSLEFGQIVAGGIGGTIVPGIVLAYNIETSFFGSAGLVPVQEVQTLP